MDFKTRDKDGMKPSLPILQKIQDVKSMSDFQQLAHDFMYTNYALPFPLTVEAAAKDGSQKQLVLRQPEALLQSPDLYKKVMKKNKQPWMLIGSQRQHYWNKPENQMATLRKW